MPQLKRQTERLYLPSTEHETVEEDKAWVEVMARLNANNLIAVQQGGETSTEQTLSGLASFITDWNFTEDDGTPTPITVDNIRKMEITDFNFVGQKLYDLILRSRDTGLATDEKKTSLDTSPTPTAETLTQI